MLLSSYPPPCLGVTPHLMLSSYPPPWCYPPPHVALLPPTSCYPPIPHLGVVLLSSTLVLSSILVLPSTLPTTWCLYFSAVLDDVSGENVAGRRVHQTAKNVCLKAQKLIKDMEYEKKRGGKMNSIRNIQTRGLQPRERQYILCIFL